MAFDLLKGLLSGNIEEISPKEVETKDLIVVDVRKPSDYRKGHIPGAVNLPYSKVEEKLEEVLEEVDKEKEIAVVCVRGISSKTAVKKLMEAGYEEAKSLKGGMKAWTGEVEEGYTD